MSKIDPILFSKESKPISKTAAGEKLNYWITVYGWEKIKGELSNLEKKCIQGCGFKIYGSTSSS